MTRPNSCVRSRRIASSPGPDGLDLGDAGGAAERLDDPEPLVGGVLDDQDPHARYLRYATSCERRTSVSDEDAAASASLAPRRM